MARRKTSTTVYLEPEQLEKLQALSGKTKVPVAEYIRQGIDLVLKRVSGEWHCIRFGCTGNAPAQGTLCRPCQGELLTKLQETEAARLARKLRRS